MQIKEKGSKHDTSSQEDTGGTISIGQQESCCYPCLVSLASCTTEMQENMWDRLRESRAPGRESRNLANIFSCISVGRQADSRRYLTHSTWPLRFRSWKLYGHVLLCPIFQLVLLSSAKFYIRGCTNPGSSGRRREFHATLYSQICTHCNSRRDPNKWTYYDMYTLTRSGPKIPAADYSEGDVFFGFEEKNVK